MPIFYCVLNFPNWHFQTLNLISQLSSHSIVYNEERVSDIVGTYRMDQVENPNRGRNPALGHLLFFYGK